MKLFWYMEFGRITESHYICNVFFIVLDLRLTKDWLSGIDSLFLCFIIRWESPKLFVDNLQSILL